MKSRLGAILLFALFFPMNAALAQQPASAAPKAKVSPIVAQTRDTQAAITPAIALQMLKDGNTRFTGGRMTKRDLMKQVKTTGSGQYPFAAVVSCMDSRAAPELVFDQGIGDIFSPRIAGNFANDDIIGSLEYGSRVAGAKLIVVLGHTDCGAIKGACDSVQLGNLTGALARIKPAMDAVPDDGSPRNSRNYAFVQKVADMNVKLAVKQIREKSPILREMIDRGEVGLVGAMLDVKTGKVTFYDKI